MAFQNPDSLFSAKAHLLKPSTIGEIHKLLETPGMRSLAGAWPDPAVFQSVEIYHKKDDYVPKYQRHTL